MSRPRYTGNTHFICKYCDYKPLNYLNVLKHYEIIHLDSNLTCGIDGCPKIYKNVRNLKNHSREKHKEFHAVHVSNKQFISDLLNTNQLDADSDTDQLNLNHDADMDIVETDDTENIGNSNTLVKVDYEKCMAKFMLTMREKHKVPQTACTAVASEIKTLIELNNQQFASRLYQGMHLNVESEQYSVSLKNSIETCLREQNALCADSCERLDTNKKLMKYVENNFTYIAREEHILGYNDRRKPETIQYIPILKVLKAFLNHEDFLSEVLNNRKSTDGIMRDICDGDVFHGSSLFRNDHTALQIMLYYDDFTVTNPIGTRCKKNKIGAVYYSLGNLSPKYRSKLDNIQLAALCRAQYVKKYGLEKFFEPIVSDIKSLESNGINVQFEGRSYNFKGTVCFVVADNLAAHAVGGYFENFSTVLRLCRTCTGTKHDIQGIFDDTKFVKRTDEIYDKHLSAILKDSSLASVYGIKRASCLNDLQYFHVVYGFPPDLSHDIFEGVVQKTVTKVIEALVSDKIFSLQNLNDAIEQFQFEGSDKTNKPGVVPVSLSSFKLNFTQAQMWCFLRLLPLLIGTKVPEGNVYWEILLNFLDVVEFMCAHSFSKADIAYMEERLQGFNEMCIEKLNVTSTKPKRHFTVHYGFHSYRYGPLIHCSTIRFEGKHEYFKGIFNRTKNRKNICKTMAKKHQLKQALLLQQTNVLGDSDHNPSGVSMVFTRMLAREVQHVVKPIIDGKESLTVVQNVDINGISYYKGCALVLGQVNDYYQFGRLVHIFMIHGVSWFCCQILETLEYNRHFHCYIVEDSSHFVLKQVSQLADYYPLAIYKNQGDDCIILKHYIREI